MSGRSLVACSEGIDKAKKALKCRNLTQTAIAKEFAIASWSTVNKFFTGKPVDREAFLCALVGRFKAWKGSPMPFADFIELQVKPISLLLGREIEYQVDGVMRRGWAVDLAPGGELVVDPGDGSRLELNSVDQVRLAL